VIDHLSLQVRDVQRSAAFYDSVLAPLGGGRLMDFGEVIGYGTNHPEFWIRPVGDEGTGQQPREVHLAFAAADRATVVAFHDAAVAAGVQVLHAPAVHPEYHPNYFGTFVRDPDGNNVEAVCHQPE
jgi:catechol 2,3-dioxygenase-like lactoylglutathione lyase family enzyme